MKYLSTALAILVAAGTLTAQNPPQAAPPEVVAVTVIHPLEGFGGIRPTAFDFPKQVGTTISILVDVPGTIVKTLDRESGVTSITDDKGGDLGKAATMKTRRPSQRSETGRRPVLVTLETDSVPSPGATSLNAKGKISVLTGQKKTTVESNVVKNRFGSRITAGELRFRIVDADELLKGTDAGRFAKMFTGGAAGSVAIVTEADMEAITALRFKDGTGKPLETGSTVNVGLGDGKSLRIVTFDRKADSIRMEVEAYVDAKRHAIPFDVEIPLGERDQ